MSQVRYTFETKPLTHASEGSKCRYTGRYLRDTPDQDWGLMRDRIAQTADQIYSCNDLVEMLQDRLIPKKVQQVNVALKIKELPQRPRSRCRSSWHTSNHWNARWSLYQSTCRGSTFSPAYTLTYAMRYCATTRSARYASSSKRLRLPWRAPILHLPASPSRPRTLRGDLRQ